MFTFTAFVAYPRETYCYFMLLVFSAYFILEGLFPFGIIDHQILLSNSPNKTLKMMNAKRILANLAMQTEQS